MDNVKLPDSVSSSQDITSLLLELRDYNRWFKHESIKKSANITRVSEPPIISPSATEILRSLESKKSTNQQSIDALIETLEKYSRTAPSITLTLVAPTTNDIKKSWLLGVEKISHQIY